jgi:hypothetical protein
MAIDFKGQKVVVTTAHRGVFYGEVVEYDPKPVSKVGADGKAVEIIDRTITLKDSRVIVYWPAEVRGFIGLAYTGPLEGSRVSPPAPIAQYSDVTGILVCTPGAVKAWESDIWST